MRSLAKCLISALAASSVWGARAGADTPATNPEPTPPAGLSDADLAKLSQGEAIEIYDERPDKPFDRDTEVRLTGEQLAARGAVDLATALALLPDIIVRDAGRGGFNVDIRGERKGAVAVLIDGVLVTDPYYGTFDVSSIPITDIVQIRLSTAPQSPIDGPGGNGGVIEVHTRDAYGSQLVIARLTLDTLPTFGVTATARAALSERWALRISASGLGGARDLSLPGNASIGEERHAATGSARLEYRDGDHARLVIDGFVDDRHYISPPSDTTTSSILMIDRETTDRVTAKGDYKHDQLQLEGQAWVDHMYRLSRYYLDPALTNQAQLEDLTALRVGAMALATHPIGKEARWAASASIDRDSVVVTGLTPPAVRDAVAVGELAVDGQYEHKTLRLDGAAGLAVPFGVGANPWPEGKLVAKWRPQYGSIELVGTIARKGRVPSLRERFDPTTGNPSLGPELVDHYEVRVIQHVGERMNIEIAPFYRHTTGTVRASTDPADMGKLINLGDLEVRGIDMLGRVRVHRMVEVGGAYDYIRAITATSQDALDRLPRNRGEGWIQFTPERRVSVLARVTYFGDSWDQLTEVAGYSLLGLTVTSPITKDYLLVGRMDDVTNVRPETRAGYHSAGRVGSLVLQGTWD